METADGADRFTRAYYIRLAAVTAVVFWVIVGFLRPSTSATVDTSPMGLAMNLLLPLLFSVFVAVCILALVTAVQGFVLGYREGKYL